MKEIFNQIANSATPTSQLTAADERLQLNIALLAIAIIALLEWVY